MDEVDDYGVPSDLSNLMDGVVPLDEYHDEMLVMDMGQMVGRVLSEPTPMFKPYELSKVFTIKQIKDVMLVLTLEVPIDVFIIEVVFEDVVSHDVVESGTVDPPLSFDVLFGFVSRSDDVLTLSSMDLSFFNYYFFFL